MPENTCPVKGFFSLLCRDNPQVLFVRMNGGKPVHELRSWQDGLQTLPMWNDVGWDCFYTVGVTDGSGYRRADNMLSPRALFIDLDNPETSQAAMDFWLAQDRPPSAVVNTSPGKFHLYWFIEAGLDWPTWTHYQKTLAAWTNAKFGAGTADGSVCDAPRIMRLPASLHHKAEPYRGSVVSLTNKVYALTELVTAFPKVATPQPVSRQQYRPDTPFSKFRIAAFKDLLTTIEVLKEVKHGPAVASYVVTCPNADEHSDSNYEAMLYVPSADNGWAGGFHCMHNHCKAKYGTPAIRKLMLLQQPAIAAAKKRQSEEMAAYMLAQVTFNRKDWRKEQSYQEIDEAGVAVLAAFAEAQEAAR